MFRSCSLSLHLQVTVKLFHKSNTWVRVMGGERLIRHFSRDYPQSTGYANVAMAVCHLTYGEVTGRRELITANMLDILIWMITQIQTLENWPNIDDKLIQAWFY